MTDSPKRLRFLLRTIKRNQERKKQALRDAQACEEKVKRHKKELFELLQEGKQ